MGPLIQIALNRGLIGPHGRNHSPRGFPRRSEHGLNKTAGLFRTEDDALAAFQNRHCGLSGFREHKTAGRLAGYGRGLADDRLVFSRYSRDQALSLPGSRTFQCSWHVQNVHQSGTQVKPLFRTSPSQPRLPSANRLKHTVRTPSPASRRKSNPPSPAFGERMKDEL